LAGLLSLGFLLVRVLAGLRFLAGFLVGRLVLFLAAWCDLSLGGSLLHFDWWCLLFVIILIVLIVLIIILHNYQIQYQYQV
jgi:hypothetical protein